MQSHQPKDYRCPFCNIAAGGEDQRTLVWEDELCIGVVALHQRQGNQGSLLLFPKRHYENLYVLPDPVGAHLFRITKVLGLGLKEALQCDGLTVRQNNEPAGGQDVWHFHIHVVPRYNQDQFQFGGGEVLALLQRVEVAQRVKAVLSAA